MHWWGILGEWVGGGGGGGGGGEHLFFSEKNLDKRLVAIEI